MGKNPYAAALSSMTRPGLPAGVTLTRPSRRPKRKKPEEEQPARQTGPDWRNVEIAYRRALLEERRATRRAQQEEAERERKLRLALARQQTRAALLLQGMKSRPLTRKQIEQFLAGGGAAAAGRLGPAGAATTPRESYRARMLLRRGIRVGTPHEMEDIRAERKRSQAALRASELRLRQRMMRAVPVIRFISGAGNRYDLTYGAPRTAEQARQHARFLEEMRRGHKAIEQQVRGEDVASQVRGLNLLRLRAARRGPYGEPVTLKPFSAETKRKLAAPEPLPLEDFLRRYPNDVMRAARAYLAQEGIPDDTRQQVAQAVGLPATAPAAGGEGEVRLTPADYAEIAGQVGQYGVLPRVEEDREREYMSDPRLRQVLFIGGREFAMPNPLEGLPRGRADLEYTRLEAATLAGQLERMGLAPEQIDRILAARYPSLGAKPYTGVPQTTEEIRRLEKIAETPVGAAAPGTAPAAAGGAAGAAGAGGEIVLGGPAPLTPEQKARMAALETQKRLGELQAEEIVRKRKQEDAQRVWEGFDASALTGPEVSVGADVVRDQDVRAAERMYQAAAQRMRTDEDAKEFLRRYEGKILRAITVGEGTWVGDRYLKRAYVGWLRKLLDLARAKAEGKEPPKRSYMSDVPPNIPDIGGRPASQGPIETLPAKSAARGPVLPFSAPTLGM